MAGLDVNTIWTLKYVTPFLESKYKKPSNKFGCLRTIAKQAEKDINAVDVRELLADTKAIDAILDARKEKPGSLNTWLAEICGLVRVFGITPWSNDVFDRYQATMREAAKAEKARRAQNAPPQVMTENPEADLSWEKFIEYETRTRGDMTAESLLASLYALAYPRRKSDYEKLVYVDNEEQTTDPNTNYYVKESNTLVYQSYKTFRVYSTQVYDESCHDVMPNLPELMNIMSSYVEHHQMKVGDSLFQDVGTVVTNMTTAAYGVRVTSSVMRRLFHPWMFRTFKTGADLTKVSNMVGHSVEESHMYNIVVSEEIPAPAAEVGPAPPPQKATVDTELIRAYLSTAIQCIRSKTLSHATGLLQTILDDMLPEAIENSG